MSQIKSLYEIKRNFLSWIRRTSCMYLWNTDEGGPCVLRPTSQGAFDNPAAGSMSDDCVDYVDDSGQCVIDNRCKSVFFL